MLKFARPWRLRAALIACLIVIVAPSLAKAQSPSQAATARVEHIAVHGTSAGIPVATSLATSQAPTESVEIEVQTSGPATPPDAEVLSAPDRILLDFPGALPSAELKTLQIHRGAVKSVRAGLFFRNPPITRIVIDLTSPQVYQIVTTSNAPNKTTYVIKIGPNQASKPPTNWAIATSVNDPAGASAGKLESARSSAASTTPQTIKPDTINHETIKPASINHETLKPATLKSQTTKPATSTGPSTRHNKPGAARLLDAAIASSAPITTPHAESAATSTVAANIAIAPQADEQQPPPVAAATAAPKPSLIVVFENGMLRIHSDQSTMAEVLYEVQRQTQAEIAIPAGAEQEKVVADIGPASAREVLETLLNGSPYNFIFVGTEEKMERVILTPRDPSPQ